MIAAYLAIYLAPLVLLAAAYRPRRSDRGTGLLQGRSRNLSSQEPIGCNALPARGRSHTSRLRSAS